MKKIPDLVRCSDEDLLVELRESVAREREETAEVVALLAEVDARLYLAQGCSSLFTYCTRVLHFSEHAAYGRIEAARAARRFPVILDLLTEGAINLTTLGLLARHLTNENHERALGVCATRVSGSGPAMRYDRRPCSNIVEPAIRSIYAFFFS